VHALIIEQDDRIVLMIEQALGELGFTRFHYAASVEEAKRLFGRHRPDLVTSGVHLGGRRSGIDLMEALLAEAVVPYVFVTATSWEVRARYPDAIVVQKPFAPRDLQAAVRAARGQRAGPPVQPGPVPNGPR